MRTASNPPGAVLGELSIPSSIAEVTPAWLTAVLHTSGALAPDAKAVVLQPIQIGVGVGIMGEIHRVAIDYEGDAGTAPASVVVKLPSPFEENREQGITLGIYEAEVRFYAELGERTGSGIPDIHLSKIVSGTADFVIVMEDLSHLDLIDQATGMTPAQAGAAIRVLAGIHASWWEDVHEPGLEWIPTMTGPRVQMVDGLFPDWWPMFFERFEDHLPRGSQELGDAFSTNYLRLTKKLADRAPWTLAHQDYRVENIMFGDPANDEVVVIDWQSIARGPGAYDVAYLLGGSMAVDDRRAHEDQLVADYHQRLVESGVDSYPIEDLEQDYALGHCLGGLAVTIFAGATLDLANSRGRELIATMAERHFTAALDHGGVALMD